MECILSTDQTLVAITFWLILPACFIAWLFSVIGSDLRLLYLASAMLGPASLTLLAPWLSAWWRKH